jgi:hypothetical protein
MKNPDEIRRMIEQGKRQGTVPAGPLDMSKVSFGIGRPLSEEEFKAMCRSKNMTPQVHRVDSEKK